MSLQKYLGIRGVDFRFRVLFMPPHLSFKSHNLGCSLINALNLIPFAYNGNEYDAFRYLHIVQNESCKLSPGTFYTYVVMTGTMCILVCHWKQKIFPFLPFPAIIRMKKYYFDSTQVFFVNCSSVTVVCFEIYSLATKNTNTGVLCNIWLRWEVHFLSDLDCPTLFCFCCLP